MVVQVMQTNVLAVAHVGLLAPDPVFHLRALSSVGGYIAVLVGLGDSYAIGGKPLWTSILQRNHIAMLINFLLGWLAMG